jgi:hypothetical protein
VAPAVSMEDSVTNIRACVVFSTKATAAKALR